eukprot:scaffold80848_cov30-Tisochrysis_lutea.AAC.4
MSEPLEQERLNSSVSVKPHAVDGTWRQPTEPFAQDTIRRWQQMRRHNRNNEARAVCEHCGKDRRNDRCLALAHDELMAKGATLSMGLQEFKKE